MIFSVQQEPAWLGCAYQFRGFWNPQNGDTEAINAKYYQGKGYLCDVVARDADDTPGEMIPPFMKLHGHQAQQLMDAMWDAGIRPSNGIGNTGQIAATEAHLKDIRAILYHKLRMRQL
jgi:hypothetical protein